MATSDVSPPAEGHDDRDLSSASSSVDAEIVIVGGGIAGLATALALHRSGLNSLVLERADVLRASGTALTLWANAWKALDALGISEQLRTEYPYVNRLQILGEDGSIIKNGEFQNGNMIHEMRCVERRALLEGLAKELPLGTVRFNSDVVAIHQKTISSSRLIIELRDKTTITTKVLVGCDGIHSVVARWMGSNCRKVDGRYAIRGMTAYSNPEGHGLEIALHQILGRGFRVGYIPVKPSEVFWFISHRKHSKDTHNGRDSQVVIDEALELVRGMPPNIADMIKRTQLDTVTEGALQMRWVWPMLCGKPFVRGRVALAGDAMHSMTPDIGQGGCLALEDAVVLGRCISKAYHSNTVRKAGHEEGKHGSKEEEEMKIMEKCLQTYSKERRGRVFALQLRSFMTGEVMDGHWWLPRLLRGCLLRRMPASSMFVKHTQFDCGSLASSPPS